MGTPYRINTRDELLKVICTAKPELRNRRTEIITIMLWSGRMIVADFQPIKDNKFDIVVRKSIRINPEVLIPYLLKIMEERMPFTMKLEARGVIYPLRWRIKEPQKRLTY